MTKESLRRAALIVAAILTIPYAIWLTGELLRTLPVMLEQMGTTMLIFIGILSIIASHSLGQIVDKLTARKHKYEDTNEE